MSFHQDMFHETKRERKKYEDKKQKALHAIQALEEDMGFSDVITNVDINHWRMELREIIKKVNDI
tara:strand:+ start:384 stop:578 length:195 start_codon:yes stop_codon:yes gene_type:complete